MDPSEPETLAPAEKTKDTAAGSSKPSKTSGQGENGPKPKKTSLKRKAGEQTKTKPKKPKRARVARPTPLGYTVHQGEDMLLVISSTTSQYEGSAWAPPKKKGGKKKKKPQKGNVKTLAIKRKKPAHAKPTPAIVPVTPKKEETNVFVPEKATDQRWGQSLPEEVLINIFKMVVSQDGAVPFLCRAGSVCRLWNAAASSPALWRSVTVGHCWIAPGKSQVPKTEQRIKDTVSWLAQNRFSQLRDFSLCHWTKNTNFAIDVVSQFCPHLRSLKLSYCTGLTATAFQSLGVHSRSLESIDLQYSEFQIEGILEFFENHGSQIKQILFSHRPKNDKLLTAISRGFCPDLELLEVNTNLNSNDCELPICIQALQMACPKLKTFRMLNVRPLYKTMRSSADSSSGFPLLEELCMATTSYSYMTDKELLDILFGSPQLRVLDLRGCSRLSPTGLASIPCPKLECLFWGQHFTSKIGLSSPVMKKGVHMLTQKWSQTLQQLDVANQLFSEEDLEIAMSHLAQATEADTLRSLNLSGTRITQPALRSVIAQTTALNYLNLSACRNLPRGLKRIYRGRDDIWQLLDKLE